jgi:hypothetical protein
MRKPVFSFLLLIGIITTNILFLPQKVAPVAAISNLVGAVGSSGSAEAILCRKPINYSGSTIINIL